MTQTHWSDYPTPQAITDRGWLKALTLPFDRAKWMDYNYRNMPVFDDGVPGNWREQSTIGNYLDYGPCRTGYSAEYVARMWPDGLVHCVCYAAGTSKYVRTVEQAKAWIESECARVRPELVFGARPWEKVGASCQ
jgi:hypothetical protein